MYTLFQDMETDLFKGVTPLPGSSPLTSAADKLGAGPPSQPGPGYQGWQRLWGAEWC